MNKEELLEKVSNIFLYRGNAYHDIEWEKENFEFDVDTEEGESYSQEVKCLTYSPFDVMYRIPEPYIDILIREAQKHLLDELEHNLTGMGSDMYEGENVITISEWIEKKRALNKGYAAMRDKK